ncbi:hypothetical protein DDB_G0271874 [Dictyostelium discoideum AX4]|uniref:Uncharacterized protein n=1 Tax=Dictyostelium discoideum TaxID=44689 RepID=Q55AH2_DICDI|nr:hypothetical protein DDB_G0271874 [Dictyostelium discoideum AX4]EAL71516.1 hypothetical protein DDB_G0271874 [Dictyostelium discoideum AX4]|eukprot:XP_645437.1 hypothetical protein DDB_G0271874 [Dictyostelium discoideum AX4]
MKIFIFILFFHNYILNCILFFYVLFNGAQESDGVCVNDDKSFI